MAERGVPFWGSQVRNWLKSWDENPEWAKIWFSCGCNGKSFFSLGYVETRSCKRHEKAFPRG